MAFRRKKRKVSGGGVDVGNTSPVSTIKDNVCVLLSCGFRGNIYTLSEYAIMGMGGWVWGVSWGVGMWGFGG